MKELVGIWSLNTIYYKFEDGSTLDVYGTNPIGVLEYHSNGNVNAQLGKKHWNYNSADDIYANYMAYFGKYYEESPGKLIHKIIGCVNPDWVDKNEVRYFELNGDTLKIWTPKIEFNGKTPIIEVFWRRSNK